MLVLLLLHHGIEVAVGFATGCYHLVMAVLESVSDPVTSFPLQEIRSTVSSGWELSLKSPPSPESETYYYSVENYLIVIKINSVLDINSSQSWSSSWNYSVSSAPAESSVWKVLQALRKMHISLSKATWLSSKATMSWTSIRHSHGHHHEIIQCCQLQMKAQSGKFSRPWRKYIILWLLNQLWGRFSST